MPLRQLDHLIILRPLYPSHDPGERDIRDESDPHSTPHQYNQMNGNKTIITLSSGPAKEAI